MGNFSAILIFSHIFFFLWYFNIHVLCSASVSSASVRHMRYLLCDMLWDMYLWVSRLLDLATTWMPDLNLTTWPSGSNDTTSDYWHLLTVRVVGPIHIYGSNCIVLHYSWTTQSAYSALHWMIIDILWQLQKCDHF